MPEGTLENTPKRLDNPQAGRYTGAARVKHLTRFPGQFVLPVADEPPADPEKRKTWSPVTVVRAHAPYQEEVDQFEYEKEDTPPVVPDMTDAGHLVFLGGTLTVPTPSLNTAGGMTWTAAGEYHYVSDAVTDELKKTGVVIGQHPFVLTSQRRDAVFTGPASPASGDLPPEVELAGIGPRVGWRLASGAATGVGQSDPKAADYTYREPSYMPGSFFSDDLAVGPPDYAGLAGTEYDIDTNELRGAP